jgi:hypothetical protein
VLPVQLPPVLPLALLLPLVRGLARQQPALSWAQAAVHSVLRPPRRFVLRPRWAFGSTSRCPAQPAMDYAPLVWGLRLWLVRVRQGRLELPALVAVVLPPRQALGLPALVVVVRWQPIAWALLAAQQPPAAPIRLPVPR